MSKTSPKLEFFYFESCPFCQMVMQVLREEHIVADYLDIRQDSASLERLLNDTGKRTVPCLYIDGNPMFESSDIVQWLKSNAHNLARD